MTVQRSTSKYPEYITNAQVVFTLNNFSCYTFSFDQAIDFRRGDEIKVNCSFTTTSATSPTFFGTETQDEMCFMMALVYPYDSSIPVNCIGSDKHGFCGGRMYGDFEDCNPRKMLKDNTTFNNIELKLLRVCDTHGVECLPGCKEAIEEVTKGNPCLNSKAGKLTRGFLAFREDKTLSNMLISCTWESFMAEDDREKGDHDHDHHDHDKKHPDNERCMIDDFGNEECNGETCGSSGLAASAVLILSVLIVGVFR